MEDSVAAKSKLPTKMFFISSSCLSIVRLASADLDLSQVVAGLSKGSFSIAGHCQWTVGIRVCVAAARPYFTATSQIFSRLDLPSGPSPPRVTVYSPPLAYWWIGFCSVELLP